jgi:uncharacterized membrane protein
VIQLAVALVASFLALAVRPMGTSGCAPDCDYALHSASLWTFVGSAIVLAVATGVLLVVLRVRRRGNPPHVWWIPLLGIILTIAAALVSNLVSDDAMRIDAYCSSYLDCRR